MRILQVSSASDLGGGETHVLQLVDRLKGLGHAVLVAGRRLGPLQPEIPLPFLNSADLYTVLRLRGILKRGGFDVVHAHVARDYPIVAAAAWGLRGPKVVFTRHLLYPVRPNFLYKRVDGWIAPTAQILKTIASLKPKKSAVIPNWVDLDRFAFRPHAFHRPVMVGLLGQIAPHKGHDDAIEAMHRLGSGFRLLIAGKGETSYEAHLKQKAAGLSVEFSGFGRPEDFFEKIDILILPSWEEPFGIVTLEAMASGIPVIATNVGGPAETVRGTLVPPRNSVALADAIRAVTSHEVRAAREHVAKNFDMRKVVPMIADFYRSLG